MGTSPDKLSELLFSRTRARLLGLLYGQPDRSFYLAELFRLANVGRGAVQRELARLVSGDLVSVRERGNQRLYQANREAPVFAELEGLIRKTAGIAGTIGEALTPARDIIRCAFIFGSIATGTARAGSDVDLLVIGDLDFERLVGLLMDTHDSIGREINPMILSENEFSEKVSRSDRFLGRVLNQEKLFIVGGPDDLEELATDRPAD